MSKIIDGNYNRLDMLQYRAFRAHSSVDTTLFNAKDRLTQDNYKAILREKFVNPTAAGIAMKDARNSNPVLIGGFYKSNMAELEQELKTKNLISLIKSRYEKLYPKTGAIRDLLIEHDCFKLNKVTPKTSLLKKALIKLEALLK